MATPKRKAMGKGLAALLNDTGNVSTGKDQNADKVLGSIAEIPLEQIVANPDQPRTLFDPEALEELAVSIKELGIIQPITVRKVEGDNFQIISGERRYRASKIAGLDSIPAYIRLADDQSTLEMALVENIQREELDPIEIALSYQRLIEECDLTQEAMSERVGKKRSTITNYLRLLKLQPLIQAGLRDKMISMGHARALINVEQEEEQVELYHDAIKKDLSVRQIEEAVRKLKTSKTESTSKASTSSSPLPENYAQAQENLSEKLQMKVDLSRSKRGRGKISISFRNDAELDRILEQLQN
ncbi:ParB/RepB/Spo0J family partition protein [Croceimicrobium hydrocarbonivorans]|uniref:ParB/RepB/Spo0J family partition protein n=1 Tax=Croceimicrobium hydrocarbonivorans TaxID=2761580 RepID=A0A7H0VE41_9FLAO|nr:ParB/RepB/Spo0J family partition protein [Croceimicrobium hydrocarbonivorans]QNR23989.1 ParB/RepB/Spo0J family partition protein [Croceimicrobium hydrocarbonivorans]